MPWSRVQSDYHEHPKTHHLIALLANPLADIYPIRLWNWCLKFAPGGDLSRWSDEIVAGGIRADTAVVKALIEAGFIDRDTRQVHDYADETGQYEKMTLKGRDRWQRWKERANAESTVSKPLANAQKGIEEKGREENRTEEKKEKVKIKRAKPARVPTTETAGYVAFKDWAWETWIAAGGSGEWNTKEWVTMHRAYHGIVRTDNGTGDAKARESWTRYLTEPGEFYGGHYPSKWAREPARWLRPEPEEWHAPPDLPPIPSRRKTP